MSPISINQSGEIVFSSELYGQNERCPVRYGIFKWHDGITETLWAEKDPVSGLPGFYFDVFGRPMINDQGSILFPASIFNDSQYTGGAWIMDSFGQLNPLMLDGEILEDKQKDAILSLTDTTYYDFTNNHFALMSVLMTNERTALLAGIPRRLSGPFFEAAGVPPVIPDSSETVWQY